MNSVAGVERTILAFGAVRERILTGVRKAISRATFDLVRVVKAEKLTGQVLNVRTGRLRRSITGRVEDENDSPVGLVGTNVSYGRTHELGFKGTVPVKAHSRTIKGKAIPVRAHSRKLDLAARPFLQPALNENLPKYRGWIADAIKEGSNGPRA
jgi:phage gpG-like protein